MPHSRARAGPPDAIDVMETLEQTLRRLKQERDEADRRYNEALTALDRALRRAVATGPVATLGYDDHRSRRSTTPGTSCPAPPAPGRLAGRSTGFIWRTSRRTCSGSSPSIRASSIT